MSNLYTRKFSGEGGRRLAYRLAYGCDLLEALQAIVEDSEVSFGSINFLGAVMRAKLGYYKMHEKRWLTMELDEPMEILSGLGNVSLKDGKPFVHAHVTLLDKAGVVHGGHLLPGCAVFAGEVFIDEIAIATPPKRVYDPVTGLTLWE
jgi:predicted DNA-binding protein with PD1-like motif